MTSRPTVCFLAALAPLSLVACGGTVLGGGSDGGGKDVTIVTPDGGSGSPDRTGPAESGPIPDSISIDSGPPTDAGPGGIPCGTSTCSPETQECCIVLMSGAETCTAKGGCDGGIPIGCSGPASCPSTDVCCATFGGGSTPSVACTKETACMGLVLCMSNADCTPPEMCQPSPFPGYSVCRGPHHHHDGGFMPPDSGFVDVPIVVSDGPILVGDGGILPP